MLFLGILPVEREHRSILPSVLMAVNANWVVTLQAESLWNCISMFVSLEHQISEAFPENATFIYLEMDLLGVQGVHIPPSPGQVGCRGVQFFIRKKILEI